MISKIVNLNRLIEAKLSTKQNDTVLRRKSWFFKQEVLSRKSTANFNLIRDNGEITIEKETLNKDKKPKINEVDALERALR